MERQADMTHLKGNNALGKEALYYDKAPLSFWERQSQTKESQWVIKAFCRSNQGAAYERDEMNMRKNITSAGGFMKNFSSIPKIMEGEVKS